jgi:hypothetical protein
MAYKKTREYFFSSKEGLTFYSSNITILLRREYDN